MLKIHNRPRKVDTDEYDRQIELYLEKVSDIESVKSVATMGSIKAPGLSDIDLVVVVDDEFPDSLSPQLSVNDLDRNLYLHGPIIVPQFLASNLQEIVFASDLQCLSGDEVLQEWGDLGEVSRRSLSICYLIDFLESRLHQFSVVDEHIDMRIWLTRIWSVVHSVNLYENYFGSRLSTENSRLLETIRETRKQWLETGSVPDQLFLDAFNGAKQLNVSLFVNVVKSVYAGAELEKDLVLYTESKKMRVSDSIVEPAYASKFFNALYKQLYICQAAQIPEYAAHLSGYFPDIPTTWKPTVAEHSTLRKMQSGRALRVKEHTSWLKDNCSNAGSLGGYLGYTPWSWNTMRQKLGAMFVCLFG